MPMIAAAAPDRRHGWRDRESYYKQEQLFARLREDDVQIFIIGFVNEWTTRRQAFYPQEPKSRLLTCSTDG